MGSGLTLGLLVAATALALVSYAVLLRYVHPLAALGLAFVKFALPVAYFAWLHRPEWTLLDDQTYWHAGRTMLAQGYDPLSALLSADGRLQLAFLAGGAHFLYVWWNMLAQWLLGPHYYAPVLLNIATTTLAGAGMFKLARLAGMSQGYSRGLLAFFLLHWDVLVWSSLLNVKDVLVLDLSIAAFYFFLKLALPAEGSRSGRLLWLAPLVAVFLLLPFIRFYVPVLLLATFAGWMVLKLEGRKRFAVAAGGVLLLVSMVGSLTIPSGVIVLSPPALLRGMLRFLLTPQPWAIDPSASYLFFPSILHWAFVVPTVIGASLLWRESAVGALAALYLLVAVLFYAAVPELQGPRQRVQLDFILAWCQFHAIYLVLSRIAPKRTGYAAATPRGLGAAAAAGTA